MLTCLYLSQDECLWNPRPDGRGSSREFLLKKTKWTGLARLDMYQKTESAIVAFLEGRKMEKLYAAKQERFRIPEEKN